MSKTVSDGVVGAGYWMYMASVMANRLGGIIRAARTAKEEIPRGVFNEARRFFRLVLDDAEGKQPKNPPASSNAYFIAARALKRSSGVFPNTVPEMDDVLKGYLRFVEGLERPRSLDEAEMSIAKSLRSFFLQLRDMGGEERNGRRFDIAAATAKSF